MKKLIGLLIVIVLASIVVYPVIGCPPEPTVEPTKAATEEPTIEPTDAPTEEPKTDPTIAPTPRHKSTEHPSKGDTAPTPWINGLPETGGGKPTEQKAIEILVSLVILGVIAFVIYKNTCNHRYVR